MSKVGPKNHPGERDALVASADWFLPAIACDGTVRDSLDAVIYELSKKKDFITEIKQRICSDDGNVDQLTILGNNVKELENTLRFRLGMLSPDRHPAWFREVPKRDIGPFRSALLLAPVFPQYVPTEMVVLKKEIYDAWSAKREPQSPFKMHTESLWSILLVLRVRLNAMAQLGPRYKNYRLDEIPDELPPDLESKSLRAFLINVCNEFQVVRDRMMICFDQLWDASEKLWASQQKLLEQQAKAHQSGSKRQDSAKDEPKEQRQGGRFDHLDFGLGFADMQALRFMGFNRKPSKDLLRQRYLELAKKWHPDRQGGNEESFKLLNKAYNRLLQLL